MNVIFQTLKHLDSFLKRQFPTFELQASNSTFELRASSIDRQVKRRSSGDSSKPQASSFKGQTSTFIRLRLQYFKRSTSRLQPSKFMSQNSDLCTSASNFKRQPSNFTSSSVEHGAASNTGWRTLTSPAPGQRMWSVAICAVLTLAVTRQTLSPTNSN